MIDTNELRDRAATFGSNYLTDEEWLEVIDRLEAAEKEFDSTMRLADSLALALNTSNHERDALRAKIERMDEAMESLLIRCDDSDSGMYGTLSTSFVRDTVRIARDALEESK